MRFNRSLGTMASATLVLLRFGIPAAAAANETGAAAAGKAVYDRHCAACHGEKGDGNGPAAVWLYPKPRNFGLGLYKIQSTPAGSLPTDEDLLRSVTRGLGGSSMPSFDYLPEDQRRAVVDYVKHLTAYAGSDGRRINRFDEAKTSGTQAASIVVPPEPPLTFDSITRGKELYVKLQCLSCHGETGAGDGPSAPTLKDSLGLPIRPRDFSSGAFRGGPNGADLYTRVAVGLGGTPMVAFPDNVLNPADRWALVHFVQSLRQKDAEVNDILVPEDGLIPVLRSAGDLPADPADAAWERVDSVRVPLNPLWPEPRPIPAVGVRALHNGKELALMLQWRDETLEGAPIRVEDFQDAAALQFAMTGEFPFLGMGDAANPVNVWQWKAGWQQAVEGERPDLQTLHPAMHVDVYTEPQAEGLYRTAEAAGNLQAAQALKSPVEDANARGFGTLTSQPPAAQNVRGCGVWRDGSWSVVFLRQLSSPDADDVQLAPGRTVPIALAVWNGAQRDRNGRKAISNWFRLSLNP